MKKTWMKKLKSQSGESISEVLIASLVVSLAFVMVLSLIMASQKIIQKTDTTMESYYNARNAFEAGVSNSSTGVIQVTSTDAVGAYISQEYENISVQSKTIGTDEYVSFEKAGS
mgnify:CR=1 FL=1